ncbi:DUF58 domain-containing protein [Niallia taxi]|uniref:DUF58 domain-containing protein n=1 Tax=Niallia taxi TaxID=2499688 RepID=UPI0015F463F7|nr:DUF58 domain-containing protein [Niallia taxi]
MKTLLRRMLSIWKLLILFLLAGAAFAYAMFQGGFVSWFLFYSFLPFAIYGALLAMYPLKEWKAVRKIAKHEYNAMESMTVEVELTRKSVFPLFYLLVEDKFSIALKEKASGKVLIFPGFKKRIVFTYQVDALPRGEHLFNEVSVKTGDPLGLMEKEAAIAVPSRIIVYPVYEELSYKPFSTHYDQGATVSKERVQRDTTMAVGIREYQTGDRFSWINWKASAKRDSFMTKEFEQKQSHDILVVLDCEKSNGFETLVSFTASLIRGIIRKGAQVGLLTVEKERTAFPIRGGEGQRSLLFHHLAKCEDESPLSLANVLDNEMSTLQQQAALLITTTNLTKQLIEKTSYLANKRHQVVVFLVKDANESMTQQERSLKAGASSRGIIVIPVSKGRFKEAFSEVATS